MKSNLETWKIDSEKYRDLRNGKRYKTSREHALNKNGSSGEDVVGKSSKNFMKKSARFDPRGVQRAN